MFALYHDVLASDVFTWSNASSAVNQSGTITWENTYNDIGDNEASTNSIKTTWNLQ
ncbi:MAG: hypothetical protein ACE14M_15830 [Terriglobales bacterium]